MSKEEILIALKEIHARYCIPANEQNYTDKDYACMQYEKLIIHLQKEIDRLNNIIKELSKDVDMWNKKYNEKFNIINELEKWLEDNLGNCRTNQNYNSNQIYNLKEDIYYRCLDKLKELKECDKE